MLLCGTVRPFDVGGLAALPLLVCTSQIALELDGGFSKGLDGKSRHVVFSGCIRGLDATKRASERCWQTTRRDDSVC